MFDKSSTNLQNTNSFKSHFIGPYEIMQEIGAGGMGKVYKARHTKLNKIVAIKVMTESNVRRKQRFLIEARLTAQLKHPNIVTIYDVGSQGNIDYIVMDYLEGQSLLDYLRKNKLSPRKASKIMKEIAWALEYAHRVGVIHRDLKPGNIIMSKDEKPIVVDFGLAKDIKSSKEMTRSGELLGTPKYMAPEQIEGHNKKITATSDIYSLGVIFYEMLTGVSVVTGGTPAAIMYSILHKEVTPPRQINSRISKDLETICLKAMSKEKELRYQSCHLFAEDLDAFLNGENIAASPLNLTQKTKRLVKKQKKIIISVAVTTSLFLCLLAFLSSERSNIDETLEQEREKLVVHEQEMMEKIEKQKQEILTKKEEAEKAKEKLEIQRKVDAHLKLAKSYQEMSNWKEAIIEYSKAIKLTPRDPIIRYYQGLAYFFSKENELAVKEFSIAIDINPKYKEAYLSRAYSLGLLQKITEAMNDLDTAITIDPNYVEGYLYRGLGYSMQHKLEKAISDFSTALSINFQRTDIMIHRGIIYERMGNAGKAELDFLEVLDRQPNNVDVQKRIAELYQKQNQHQNAIKYYKKFLQNSNIKEDERKVIEKYIKDTTNH